MTTHTILFNGYAACHTDDPQDMLETLKGQFAGACIVAVPYSKAHPPLEVNGVRQDTLGRKDETFIDGLNFVD